MLLKKFDDIITIHICTTFKQILFSNGSKFKQFVHLFFILTYFLPYDLRQGIIYDIPLL